MEINASIARMWARLGPRAIFGQAMLSVAEKNLSIMALTGDLGHSSGLARFEQTFPDRYVNVGIAEQNMIGVAAGLAKEGHNVFTTSFAPFIALRAGEQIRMNLGYMNLNVKAVGIGSGLSMAFLGNSHYGIEDAAIMRAIPNMTVVCPADCVEVVKVVHAASEFNGPMYIRLTGAINNPVVYTEDYNFSFGKSVTLRKGDEVTIFAHGTMVFESLEAAKYLEKDGISATVINMHTLKPLDYDAIDKAIAVSKIIVTVEEHSVIGGLGSAVSEYISQFSGTPAQLTLGLPDKFGKTAEYKYLLEKYRLSGSMIASDIKQFYKQHCK